MVAEPTRQGVAIEAPPDGPWPKRCAALRRRLRECEIFFYPPENGGLESLSLEVLTR